MTDPSRIVSLRDIAAKVGVSHATVSMALRDDPEISAARRKEIRRVAESMGYRPDPLLQQLATYRKSRRTARIESCIAWLNDWEPPGNYHKYREYACYWKGARAGAESLGFRLEEILLRNQAPSPERLVQMLLARGIRGVLIPPHRTAFRYAACDWTDFSVVKIGFSVASLRTHLVTSDQYVGGGLAASHMLKAGHRRIGFVSTLTLEQHTRGNFSAAFLHTRDKAITRTNHIPALFLEKEDAAAKKQFIQWLNKHKPTALLFSPPSVPAWVRESGLSIPRDIALGAISMLDSPLVDAGLDQFPEEVGRAAVELLSSLMNARHFGMPGHPRSLLIEPRWVSGVSLPDKAA
jgi:DNA-binding LacI/PurR family transcriptional regulator